MGKPLGKNATWNSKKERERIIIISLLGKQVMRVGGGCNWFKIILSV
jgi:hypothetical protein